MAAAKYTKGFMPFRKVKEKEFLSRPLGCRAVGFSLVRYKPGQGAAYVHRHKVQEEVFITLKGTERGRSSWMGSESRCPKEPSFVSPRRSIEPSATIRKGMWFI
jgi:uncharacterized cupin superfamily protein